MWIRFFVNLGLSTGCALLLTTGLAQAQNTIRTQYEVRVSGVYVGDARLDTTIDKDRYQVDVFADVGVLFISRQAKGSVRGRYLKDRLTPESYTLSVTGGEATTVKMAFAGGNKASATITPPIPREYTEGRVALSEKNLVSVLDPLSAMLSASLIRDFSPDKVCSRTKPIFTGYARFDIALSPAQASRAVAGVSCRATYKPIEGHRPAEPSVQRLAASREIEIAFVPPEAEGPWVIGRISVPTNLGTLTIERVKTTTQKVQG